MMTPNEALLQLIAELRISVADMEAGRDAYKEKNRLLHLDIEELQRADA